MSLSRYRSHKEVEAGQITDIALVEYDGSAVLHLEDILLEVDAVYLAKHQPVVGGYYVRYADGYESFSPAEAFEQGYTAIADEEDAAAQLAAWAQMRDEDEQSAKARRRHDYVLAALTSLQANVSYTPDKVARVAFDRADALMLEFDRRRKA